MKGISLRLTPSLAADAPLTNRLVRSSLKQFNVLTTCRQRLVGQWRLWLNYCPECNSCAPKLHHCEVCQANTKAYFSWNNEVRDSWWRRYAHKHHIVV